MTSSGNDGWLGLIATANYTDLIGVPANLLAAHIGAWLNGASIEREFDGLIDEFAIYGSVL